MDRRNTALAGFVILLLTGPCKGQRLAEGRWPLGVKIEAKFSTTSTERSDTPSEDADAATEKGSGIIIGSDRDFIYVATALHVVRKVSDKTLLEAKPITAILGGGSSQCDVLVAPEQGLEPDAAVLRCGKPAGLKLPFVVLTHVSEVADGWPLDLAGTLEGESSTRSGFVFRSPLSESGTSGTPRMFDFMDVFDRNLEGVSGSAALTARREMLGMEIEDVGTGRKHAYRWDDLETWIKRRVAQIQPTQPNFKVPINLKYRSRSAPVLRSGNVEVTAESMSLFVPRYGWMKPAPHLRLAGSLPGSNLVALAFDFTFAENTRAFAGGTESLSLVVPAVTAEFALGSVLPALRTERPFHGVLGGLHVGAGGAPVFLQDTLTTYNVQSASIHAWATVFDLGWRYRLKRKQWGVTALYREGVLLGSDAQSLYPRFRSLSGGVFVLLH